jgi:hypothetical protein
MYVVILDVSINGASFRTTEDVIEAPDATEAERIAVEQWKAVEPRFTFRWKAVEPRFTFRWKAVEPRFTFRPLLTLAQT